MKKIINSIGLVCMAIILIASIFKSMHFPGANILLIAGLGTMTLIFLPIAYILLLKSSTDSLQKLVFHAAFISFSIDFAGMLFKIMHWPGAGWFMIIGLPLPFVLFLPAYIIYHSKRKLKTDTNFFAILLFMIYLGVFSSLLAVDANYSTIKAYAHSASEISELNKYVINETNSTRVSTLSDKNNELVQLIESIKKSTVLAANADNKEFIYTDGTIDYSLIYGKTNNYALPIYHSQDYFIFNEQFEEYSKMLKDANTDVLRLIDEINEYRLPKEEREKPLIFELPAIITLTVLNDWQNKLLLIEYLHNKSV